MKIIQAKAEILRPGPEDECVKAVYRIINDAGRTCYKSEAKDGEAEKQFIQNLVDRGHEAMLEHASITVRFTVDRGVSHELVRHRIASFAQESTRYCNYSKEKFGEEITVIEPCFFKDIPEDVKAKVQRIFDLGDFYAGRSFREEELTERAVRYIEWCKACDTAEKSYFMMLKLGAKPEEARSVLPNSLKTEVVMTANLREWRHFFRLRAAGETGKPHPQMLEVAAPLLEECRKRMPEVFGDIRLMKGETENADV